MIQGLELEHEIKVDTYTLASKLNRPDQESFIKRSIGLLDDKQLQSVIKAVTEHSGTVMVI